MLLYSSLVVIPLFLSYFVKQNKILIEYVFIGYFFVLLLIAGIRDFSVGTDTLTYYRNFCDSSSVFAVENERAFSGLQFGWLWINRFFEYFLGYDAFLFACYICILLPVFYVIKKSASNIMLSIVLYILLGMYTISFNIMRQMMAVSLMLYAFYCLKNNDIKKYWIVLIVASIIHSSAMICIIFFFLDKIKVFEKKIYWLMYLAGSFIFGMFFMYKVNEYLSLINFDELHAGYAVYVSLFDESASRSLLSNLLLNIMAFCALYFSKGRFSMFMKMYLFSILFMNLFGGMGGVIVRMSYYFNIAQIIVLPNVMNDIQMKLWKQIYLIIVLLYALGYFFYFTLNIGDIRPYLLREF
ncbi:EpsG family protein [Butyricimonas sp. Marseille-P3923]|uniref:EpsG family protein n=1 Tax=Butyricimonas sp. Marseille-P3923 TaxID=1987504 RepID=UPI000C08CA8E|nr:EpsG family protein [Butyricimonas sp. Marseille-P3923]